MIVWLRHWLVYKSISRQSEHNNKYQLNALIIPVRLVRESYWPAKCGDDDDDDDPPQLHIRVM